MVPSSGSSALASEARRLSRWLVVARSAQALGNLRKEVGNEATVLGFIGAPYTMATYCVEGGTSSAYLQIKKMGYNEPELLHALLDKLADNLAEYACYQIESGAPPPPPHRRACLPHIMLARWRGARAALTWCGAARSFGRRAGDPDVRLVGGQPGAGGLRHLRRPLPEEGGGRGQGEPPRQPLPPPPLQ